MFTLISFVVFALKEKVYYNNLIHFNTSIFQTNLLIETGTLVKLGARKEIKLTKCSHDNLNLHLRISASEHCGCNPGYVTYVTLSLWPFFPGYVTLSKKEILWSTQDAIYFHDAFFLLLLLNSLLLQLCFFRVSWLAWVCSLDSVGVVGLFEVLGFLMRCRWSSIISLVPRASPLPFPSLAPGKGKRRGPGNEVGPSFVLLIILILNCELHSCHFSLNVVWESPSHESDNTFLRWKTVNNAINTIFICCLTHIL